VYTAQILHFIPGWLTVSDFRAGFFLWLVTSSCGWSRPIYIPMKSCAVSHGKATVSNVCSKFRKESHQQERRPASLVLKGQRVGRNAFEDRFQRRKLSSSFGNASDLHNLLV
jgi:hypothetical protein